MRADGSLPLETARGARALWYQRHAIASLVAIAEIAAVQGYDLYALSADGRSLHQAVEFLARGLAEPALVLPYAAANEKPGELRQLPGPGSHLPAASRPWAALHGLARGVPGALPRARRRPRRWCACSTRRATRAGR